MYVITDTSDVNFKRIRSFLEENPFEDYKANMPPLFSHELNLASAYQMNGSIDGTGTGII